ncbi:NAD(P)-dependent oxidoreductase [Streptomyces sp. GTA36]
MNLTVLAASGQTGIALTRQALRRGHTVTAIARDPEKIALPDSPNLRKVAGDVNDAAGIAAVVDGDSVVLSALGTDRAGVLLTGARAVVAAGPRRVIWLGAYGTGKSAEAAGEGAGVLAKVLGDRLADKVEADNTVLAAGGTVFHAGMLADGPESPRRRTVRPGSGASLRPRCEGQPGNRRRGDARRSRGTWFSRCGGPAIGGVGAAVSRK